MKIKSGLSGLNAQETIVRSRYTLSKMDGNPNYSNPPYPISEILGDVDVLAEYNRQVVAGHRLQIPLRDKALKTVHYKMNLLAGYVNGEAKGDLDKLTSSGFELQKERTPATIPGVVRKLKGVKAPGSGSCRFSWSGVRGRTGYKVETSTTPEDESSWELLDTTSKTHCLVDGLEVGKFVYFRVCAYNTAGQGEWSDLAKVMVS